MSAPVTIRDLMTDPALFGGQFGGDSFAAWRALLAGFYGLPLDDSDLETFLSLTGRDKAPQAFSELWEVIGRRGGKTQIAALLSTYHAPFMDYRDKLSPGEVATVLLLAADRSQARSAMRYVRGLCEHPMIQPMIRRETETSIEFTNRTAIEIATASFRSVRGYTLACVIADEIAFWFSDGARPDAETIAAVRPGLATLGGPLIALSSPHAKRGELWRAFKTHFGNENSKRVLVAQSPSLTMNPTLNPQIVEAALAEDPERARAEYLAEFRQDVDSFLDIELVERASRTKPPILPPRASEQYHAFVDPNGGGADEFTMSIAHKEADLTVVDGVWGRHGSPAEIVADFAAILRSYRITSVRGDRYAGRWPSDEFRKHGIEYTASDRDRSALYLDFMARINSGAVLLPPDARMQRQFANLERRAHRGGRESIDHPPGGHDDRANAVAGVVSSATRRQPSSKTSPVKGLI